MKERLQMLLRDSWRKILLSLIAALAVEIAYLAAPPETLYQVSQQNNAVSIWNEEVQLVHCSMVDGKVVPSDNDPQIYFRGLEGEINNILITLREETTGAVNYQLFYPDEQGAVSQESSMVLMIPEGRKQVSFELPPGEYSFLRLDVDGVFPVEDITVSGQPLVKTSVRYSFLFYTGYHFSEKASGVEKDGGKRIPPSAGESKKNRSVFCDFSGLLLFVVSVGCRFQYIQEGVVPNAAVSFLDRSVPYRIGFLFPAQPNRKEAGADFYRFGSVCRTDAVFSGAALHKYFVG